MKFKGWDWTELQKVFGFSELKDEDAAEVIEFGLDDLLSRFDSYDEIDAKRVRRIRKFVRTVAAHEHGYDWKVYTAIAEIESDWTFLCWVRESYKGMWT